jgi:hypothetical protein
MHPKNRHISFIALVEELMDRILRPSGPLAVALVVAACGGGSTAAPTATVAPTPLPSLVATVEAASPTPSAAPTPSSSPTAFTSNTYGYSIMVPGGWTSIQAISKWDGKGAPSHDVPEADQFVGPAAASAWDFAAPTTKDLAGLVQQTITANAVDHGDTCPPVPESQGPIQIGSEPGVLLEWNCGILINVAAAVHDGVGYVFGFRDPAVHAATDPVDRATFLELLESVKFPD